MISFEAVSAPQQAEELRQLRNECREMMTGSVAEITGEQQRVFFETQIVPRHVGAWLLRRNGTAVAYALLRPADDGALWMSCGVTGKARGKGLGTLTVAFVTAMGHHISPKAPVRLEVWRTNWRARRCYLKAGYVMERAEMRGDRVVEVMAHR